MVNYPSNLRKKVGPRKTFSRLKAELPERRGKTLAVGKSSLDRLSSDATTCQVPKKNVTNPPHELHSGRVFVDDGYQSGAGKNRSWVAR
jgi:hypothetical protein